MSDSNWRKRFARFLRDEYSGHPLSWWEVGRFTLWLIVTGWVLWLLLVSFLSLWHWLLADREAAYHYDQRADHHRHEAARQIAERCNVPSAPAEFVGMCLADEIRAYRERTTSYEDLDAQQKMARWTAVMGLVGVFSIPVSLAGLLALWFSLNHTRQAISVDREIGHAQVRAYISVFDFETLVTDDPSPIIKTTIIFKNTGATPAKKLKVTADWSAGDPPFDEKLHPIRVASSDGRGTVSSGATFFASLNTKKPNFKERVLGRSDIEKVIAGEWKFWVFGVVEYIDVFDQCRKTRFRYEVMIDGDRAGFSPSERGNEEN